MKNVYFKKKLSFFLMAGFCLLCINAVGQPQDVVYENFDGTSTSLVSNSIGFAAWKTNSEYFRSYPNSYRGQMPLIEGNEVTLETPELDLTNSIFLTSNASAFLRFWHICKIDVSDIARIEYAEKMGTQFSSWQPVPWTAYMGNAADYALNGFSAASYPEWQAANLTARPTQEWWKEELFDLTSFLGSEVKFRLVLKKGASAGTAASYGWLIDNFEIIASANPILFPTAEFVAPLVRDTVYRTGPFEVTARITSNSSTSMQTPWLKYIIVQNNGTVKVDSVLMTSGGFGLWNSEIAQAPLHSKVYYSIKGMDMQGNNTTIYSEYVIANNDALGNNSAALVSIDSPVQQAGLSASPIKITLQNKGEHNLDSATIYWQLNSNAPSSITWRGNLPWNYMDTTTIGTYTPTPNAYDTLTIWISNPNNAPNTSSDTLQMVILYGCSGGLNGNIAVGNGTTFPTLSSAIDALRRCGVSNNVVFQLANGIYQENIDLTNLETILGNHSLTISSALGSKEDVSIQPLSGAGITLGNTYNVTISNITIDAFSGTHAIEMVNTSKNIIISDNVLKGATLGSGIHKADSTGSLENCFIVNNEIDGGDYGIYLSGGDEISILSNIIKNAGNWGVFADGYKGSISGNKIHQSTNGISISNMNWSNTLEKGLISNNEIICASGIGIVLSQNSSVSILHNSVYAKDSRGISIADGADITISVRNNLFATEGTSGYPIYLEGITNINQWDIDYNNYSSSNGNIGYAGGAISDLTAWRTAVPSDQNSTDNVPDFTDNTLHLQLDHYTGFECPLLTNVANDVDGLLRMRTTTMGCYSGVLANQNSSLTELINWGNQVIQNRRDTVMIVLVNGGNTPLTSANIAWEFNNTLRTSVNLTKTLNTGDSAVISLGEVIYTAGSNTLKAWIVNSGNSNTKGDTISVAIAICDSLLSGTYVVGTSTGSHFSSIEEALNKLYHCGMNDAVALRLQDGIYTETVNIIGEIPGSSATNTLTITSQSGNNNNVTIKPTHDAGIILGNVNHLIIEGITVDATTSSSFGVNFIASCDNIEIKNSIIKAELASIYKKSETGIANDIRIINNTMLSGTSSASAWTGIELQNSNAVINANRIKQQSNNITSSTGIRLTAFNNSNTSNSGLVSNNEIMLRSTTSAGILIESNVNADIVHNSIYMDGIGATRAIELADANNRLLVQNNNLITKGTDSYPFYMAGTTYLSQWDIDYNNMLAPQYVGFAEGNKATISEWRTVVLSDLHSVSVQPFFRDITNSMELLSSEDILCPLLFTLAANDIDNIVRTSPTTMGAYHRKQPNENVRPVTVVSPQEFYNTGDALSIQFENMGLNALTSLTIYWSVNGGTPKSMPWIGPLAQNATSQIVVLENNLVLPDISNHIIIWTSNPNGLSDDEPFNDTIKAFVINCNNGVSGTFTVGQGGEIPTLQTAITILERCGINGAVEFSLLNGTHDRLQLGRIQGISPTNTITFRSQSGNPSGTIVQGIVFDTISHIILKDIHIQAAGGVGIAFNAQANNVEIRGCTITTNTSAGSFGIQKVANTGLAENIRIVGNTIIGGYSGIEFYVANDANRYGNIIIDSNTLTDAHYYGLYLCYADASVSYNNINSTSSQQYWTGANISHTNGIINGNTIRQNTATSRSCGLELSNLNVRHTSVSGIVSNNEIYMMTSDASNFQEGAGIRVGEAVAAAIVHNAVSNQQARAIDIIGHQNSVLTVKNNIFVVRNSGSNTYPIYLRTVAYLPQWDIDYNNYYSPSTIGFAGEAKSTLANWKTTVKSDIRSVNINNTFLGSTLEPNTYNGLECPAANGVNADIKNKQRLLTTSMGAYSMDPLTADVVLATLLNWNPRIGGSDTIKVVLKNGGITAITQIDYTYIVNGTTISDTWIRNLTTGASDTIILDKINYIAGNNTFKVWIDATINSNSTAVIDQFQGNDTVTVSFNTQAYNGTYTVGQGGYFPDITTAVSSLMSGGINGAVILNIKDGHYVENPITIGDIPGSSTANTITFTSESGDSSKVRIQKAGAWSQAVSTATFVLNGASNLVFSNLTIDGRAAQQTGTNTSSKAIILGVPLCNNIEINTCHLIAYHSGTNGDTPNNGEAFAVIGLSGTAAANKAAHANIRILNNNIDGGAYAMNLRGAGSTSPYINNLRIENNIIQNWDFSSVYVQYGENVSIKNNIMYQRRHADQIEGTCIYFDYGDFVCINNKINMQNMQRGIYHYGNPTARIPSKHLIINNEIIGSTKGANAVDRGGIVLTGSLFVEVFHNSVYIGGTGVKYGFSIRTTPSNANAFFNVQNNNFAVVGEATNSRPIRVNGVIPSNINTYYYINNNNYFREGGGDIGRSGSATGTSYSMPAWQALFTYDAGSVNIDPIFTNPTQNLVCAPNAALQCPLLTNVPEVLTDINGVVRQSPTDRGAYQSIPKIDVLPYSLISPTATSIVGTSMPVIVTIRNASMDVLDSVDIFWEANGASNVYKWTGNLVSGGESAPITLGTFMPLLYDSNNIVIITSMPNGIADDEPTNDTLRAVSFGCASIMQGSYIVGTAAGADFPNIATAVRSLYLCGINAPVTIALQDGIYNENILLSGAIPGASDINTVMFTSLSGDTSAVTIKVNKTDYTEDIAPFTLDNVSHVIISKLHLNGAIDALSADYLSNAKAIVLQRICENIEISDCKLTVPNAASLLIGSDRLTNIFQSNGSSITDIRIINNSIDGGSYGISLNGTTNALIQNNNVRSVDYYGIRIAGANNFNISHNTIIQNLRAAAFQAIYSNASNGDITANRIRAVSLSRGIYLASVNGLIANNEIIADNYSSSTGAAIYASSCGDLNVWHNSILVKPGSTTGRGIEFAIAMSTYSNTAKNNNIAVFHSTGYPVYLSGDYSTNAILDYNNYYAPTNIGFLGSAQTDFTVWRGLFTNGNDVNSVRIQPVYVDSTVSLDLANVDSLSCPASLLVMTDINGKSRIMSNYMGAYIPTVPFDAALLRIEIPAGVITGQPYLPKLHFQNVGTDTVRKLEIGWSLNGTTQPSLAVWTGTLAQLETVVMDLDTIPIAANGENTIVAWIESVNDSMDVNPLNDIAELSFYICNALIDSVNIVGVGETFETIAEAIDKIKECGIGGDVYLRLKEGAYSRDFGLTDFFPFGNPYKVKITADSGANVVISSNITIQNSTNIIIEGITINANIQLDGCSDIVINNCHLLSIQKQQGTRNINNIRITNNIIGGTVGLTGNELSNSFNGNIVVDSNEFTNSGAYAINASHIDFSSISYNKITRSGTTMYIRGSEGSIIGNKIRIQSTSTGGLHGINIGGHNLSNPTTGRLIANNEIIVIAPTPATGAHSGIYIYHVSNIDIVHNSILLQESGSGIGTSAGIYFYASNQGITHNNNIILTSTMLAYPIFMGGNFAGMNINYNNYYAPMYIGFIQGYTPQTLADWKMAVLSDDSSVHINPLFPNISQSLRVHELVYAALLCPQNPNVPIDINGKSRGRYTIMGAYEGIQLAQGYDLEFKEIVEPNNATTLCSPNYTPIKYAVRNLGNIDYDFSINPLELHFYMDAELTFDTMVIINSGLLPKFAIDTFELKSNLNVSFAGNYDITAWINSVVDTLLDNDTLRTLYNSGKIKLPYENDFTANPFKNLTKRSLTSDGKIWDTVPSSSTIQPQSGAYLLEVDAPAGAVTQLITNQIELNRTIQPVLKFWYAHDNLNPDSYDQTIVKIIFNGDENTAIIKDYIRRYDPAYTTPTWVEHTVDLSPYTDSSCVIVIFESHSFGGAQYIDSMSIISNQNLALDTILTPDFLGCNFNGLPLKVVLSNTTNQDVDFNNNPLNIAVQIRGDMTKDTLVVVNIGMLEGLESDTIVIYPQFDFAIGSYTIKAYIEGNAMDLNQADDTTSKNVTMNPNIEIRAVQMTQTGSCFPIDMEVYPKVEIENTGNIDLEDIPIEMEVAFDDTTYEFSHTLQGVLAAGSKVEYEFNDYYIVRHGESFSVISTIELPCANGYSYVTECIDMLDLSVDSLVNFTTPHDNVGENITLKVKLTNHDLSSDFTDVEITALINDGSTTTDSLTGTIDRMVPQSDTVYTFTMPYIVSSISQYTVKVYVNKNDENQKNDTLLYERTTDLGTTSINTNNITLGQNIPNPTNGYTVVDYSIPTDGQLVFAVYSVTGQILYAETVDADAGNHYWRFNTENLATGIYYYSMTFKGQRLVKKMNVQR